MVTTAHIWDLVIAANIRPFFGHLKAGTAKRLASDVVHRAELVNTTDIFAYRVKTMVLFGSFLSGADRISDVDIACELVPRWTGEEQDEAEEFSRALHEGRFRNASECVAWPKLEVLQYLKSRSRGLSIQELNRWILKQDGYLVIFSDGQSFSGRMPASQAGCASVHV